MLKELKQKIEVRNRRIVIYKIQVPISDFFERKEETKWQKEERLVVKKQKNKIKEKMIQQLYQ